MVHLSVNNYRPPLLILFLTLLFTSGIAHSSETDHFNVTTVIKDRSYPWYEKALDTVYEVNGKQGETLVLKRDKTYTFKINTGIKHDFYFSSNEAGRGRGVITNGISNQFIHKGIIHFKPTADTPKELYYQCQNHPYMGGKIYIVDQDDNFTPPEEIQPNSPEKPVTQHLAKQDSAAKTKKTDPQSIAQQHVAKVDSALSRLGKRIDDTHDEKARKLFRRATAIAEDAKAWLSGGDINAATEDADIVMMLIDAAENRLSQIQNK